MAKSKNANLHKAKSGKNDEFYTQFNDIQNELKHYKSHFEGKIVLCNCDDPKQSNFFRYFATYFHKWGLKELITTCYKNASGEEFSALKNPSLFDGEAERERETRRLRRMKSLAILDTKALMKMAKF
ncbi:adenine-specific methyltransferase EcoRI family protein [Campylobacter majalis]|uniref:adenine-specific methyltransferase EcoRI family protein n=1 Tax=Campylobacter majalis TaxID=2790656 RepID=UPI003D68D4A3